MIVQAPQYDVDFYSDSFIRNPQKHYAAMRAMGPVIYLPRLENYALTCHSAVQTALRDHTVFSSASGVAGDHFGCNFLQGNTVASDPPRHTALRRAMAPPLLPGELENIRPEVERVAETLIEGLLLKGSFDTVTDLAQYLPLKIVTEMVGLPDFGQENMLKWAAAAFDVLGMQNARGTAALDAIAEMREFIAGQITRETLKPDSWTYRVLDLVDQEALDPELAPFAIRDYINPSLDTTISATSHMIWQLAQNPAQWQMLRSQPELCRNAVNEAVRLGTPIRSFTRHTTQQVDIEGTTIPQSARVMMLFASANRDEKVFENPDQFDITRDPKNHLGFGSGIHTCIGMHLAQLEMTSLLRAMIPRVGRITVETGEVAMNNTIAAFASLPTTFEPDSRQRLDSAPTTKHQKLLSAKIIDRQPVAQDIVCLTLESADDSPLPVPAAGSHVDVYIRDGLVRQYSLTGTATTTYQIAVQNEPDSRGGSTAMHNSFAIGDRLRIGSPRNNFSLDEQASAYLLFSGGIGLTPILSMAWALHKLNKPFEWHLSARSINRIAFGDTLQELPFHRSISIYCDDVPSQSLNVETVVAKAKQDAQLYVCGPAGYMNYVIENALNAGLPMLNIHKEHFGNEIDTEGEPFIVVAKKSAKELTVNPGETILEVLTAADIEVPTSCENGVCGSCLTRVLEGKPDHRDLVLTDIEKASNQTIAVCCSRSNTHRLVLDI